MNTILEDEDLDEIPVESRLLHGDAAGGRQERDPLQEDEDALVEEDPLEIVSVLPRTKTSKVAVERMTETHLLFKKRPLPPVPLTTVSPSVPSQEKSSLPSRYTNMSFADFTQEMEQSIINIVQESVELFHRDPREYHPVYLRMFKYITIAQKLGYIGNDKEHVKDVWSGFFKFAETQFQLSQTTTRATFMFDGERSAYATYQLTKKLDEKVASFQRNENERRRLFRKLENEAKKIRKEWIESPSRKDKILEDLDARLKFFNECKFMTHPVDCIKMNNLWKKFLSEDGIPGRTRLNPRSEADISTISASAIGLGVGVTGPSTENVVKSEGELPATSENTSEKDADKADEESKQTLRKFIIRVIVAPSKPASVLPVAPQEPSLKDVDTLAAPASSPQALSLPPSPCHSPSPIQPSSPFSPGVDEELGTISQSPTNPKLQEVASSSAAVSPKVMKSDQRSKEPKLSKKSKKPEAASKRQVNRRKVSQVATKPLKNRGVLLTRNTFLGKHASSKKNSDYIARRMKFESILSQTKTNTKLLSSITRKKSVAKKGGSVENETKRSLDDGKLLKSEVIALTSSSSALSTDKPTSTVKTTSKTLKQKDISYLNKAKSLIEKRKKQKSLLNLKLKSKCRSKTASQTKLEKIIKRKTKMRKGDKSEEMVPQSGEECLPKFVWKRFKNFRSIETVCPVCDGRIFIGRLNEHLLNVHEIIEDGDLWMCPVCEDRKFVGRIPWLNHMNSQHKGQVNLEEMVKIAGQVNTKVDWTTMEYRMGSKAARNSKKVDEGSAPCELNPQCPSITNQDSAGTAKTKTKRRIRNEERREVCDVCGACYLPRYMPIHKDAAHNPNRRRIRCPNCPKTLLHPMALWCHYCEFHIHDQALGFLDPVPVEDKQSSKRSADASRNPDEPVTCEICGKLFANGNSLTRHVQQIHNEGEIEETFVCPHCPKTYKVKDVLTSHIRTVHQGMCACKQCGRNHQSPGKLWRHLIDVHGMSAADAAAECKISFVQCPYCGEQYLEGRQIKNHVQAQHPEKFQEFTPTCPTSKLQRPRCRPNRSEKKREQRRLCKEQGIGPAWIIRECERNAKKQSEVIKCTIEGCGAILKSREALKKHLRAVHTKSVLDRITEKKAVKVVESTELYRTHLCVLCREYLCHIQEVKVHMVARHPELFRDGGEPEPFKFRDGDGDEPKPAASIPVQEFECPHCPLKFPSDEDVRGHVDTSHSDLCWRCPECSKVMLGPDDLDRHFLVDHSNENGQGDGPNQGKEDEIEEIVTFPCFKRIRLKKFYSDKEKLEIKQELKKFDTIKVHCEICNQKLTLGSLSKHIFRVHGVVEDLLACTFCPEGPKFKPTSHTGRGRLAYHMNQLHLNKISLEEIIALVSKVNSSKDWRTLEIKNPIRRKRKERLNLFEARGKKGSTSTESSEESDSDGDGKEDIELETILKKARKSQVSRNLQASLSHRTAKRKKTLDSSDEDDSDKSDLEGTRIKVAVSLSPPRRSFRESAKRAANQIKKYAETLKEQDGEGKSMEMNLIEGEKGDSGKKGVEVISRKPLTNVAVTRPASGKKALKNRLLRRGETMNDNTLKITASSLSKDNSEEDEINLVDNIEKEKRLVIELVRLTEKEVENHLRKY